METKSKTYERWGVLIEVEKCSSILKLILLRKKWYRIGYATI
jgi:hypothetical protein